MSRQAAHAKAKSSLRSAPSPPSASLSRRSEVEGKRAKWDPEDEKERDREMFPACFNLERTTLHPLARLASAVPSFSGVVLSRSLSVALPRRLAPHRDSPLAFTFTARTYVLRSTAKLNTCFSQTVPTSTHHSEPRINPLVFRSTVLFSSLCLSLFLSLSRYLRFATLIGRCRKSFSASE